MTYRMIILILPEDNVDNVKNILYKYDVLESWYTQSSEGKTVFNIIIRREKTESLLNVLQRHFSDLDGFRISLLPVEASIPVPEPIKKSLIKQKPVQENDGTVIEELTDRIDPQELVNRLSRHEIYADISDIAKLSKVFIIMVILSAIVAAIGVLNNNVAVIIGAMVIAPLLGPNTALSLGTVLGDVKLAKNAIKTNFFGIFTAFVVSLILGSILVVDPTIPEILLRTRAGLGSITLALASGIAGALSFTIGFRSTLIGVMVAVALLPPLVTSGLLLGSGQIALALGAFLLFLINLVCVNLSGVVTFMIQKIRPIDPQKIQLAKKMTYAALILWIVLLSSFIVSILLYRGVLNFILLG
jgi:uncharacterized hydrophobic protein (TIGR00341 family)